MTQAHFISKKYKKKKKKKNVICAKKRYLSIRVTLHVDNQHKSGKIMFMHYSYRDPMSVQ